jgi:4-diphosphocytidyl-2-C-methyl-D-erythritol kinase
MPADTETAYAKINLALHVRRRRPDGYHDIETLFAFCGDGDGLSAELADDLRLNIIGPFAGSLAATDDNLVLRTANALKNRFKVAVGAKITLDKRLPIASGIGGGSADAAATARLLNRLWDIGASEADLAALLAPLGADIPACIYSRTALGHGTGTDLEFVTDGGLAGTPVLLVNPLVSVSTASVFRAWDGIDRGPVPEDFMEGRNDLEPMALALCPEIADVVAKLEAADPTLTRMSGSGATCFALFASAEARDASQGDIAKACPEWWTMASSLK